NLFVHAAKDSKLRLSLCQSNQFARDTSICGAVRRLSCKTTSCSPFGNGRERSNSRSTIEKMAVLATIPRARVSTTVMVKTGGLAIVRREYRMSIRIEIPPLRYNFPNQNRLQIFN